MIILTVGGVILQLYQFKDGFSVLWFIYLFFVAGYIRKYNALLNWKNMSGRYFLMAFGLLAAICVTRSLINERLNFMDYLGKYNGLLTVLMAVFFFVGLKIFE